MKKRIALLVALFIMIGCGLPSTITSRFQKTNPTETQTPLPTTELSSFFTLIDDKQIVITGIAGNELNAGFIGNVLDLQLKNESGKTLEVDIPCGLIFVPEDDSIQQMMTIQPVSLSLKAGESAEIAPFVVCIQSSNATPGGGDAFNVGSIAEGKLLQLAECFCREEIDVNRDIPKLMSIQFATWMVADDTDFTGLTSEGGGALGDLIGGDNEFGDLGDFLQAFITSMAPDAKSWLDKCQVEVGEN